VGDNRVILCKTPFIEKAVWSSIDFVPQLGSCIKMFVAFGDDEIGNDLQLFVEVKDHPDRS
jgi:hypothetical protein